MPEEQMREGRIQKVFSGFFYVETAPGVVTCRSRGRLRKEGVAPLTGDRVRIRVLPDGTGVIEAVAARKNRFTRPPVANVDQLVMTACAAVPVTDPYLIDWMLSAAALRGCGALVVLNKTDLDPAEELYEIYRRTGIPTLRVSAKTGAGLDELRRALTGKLSVLTGNSGAGKSSLLNALDPSFHLEEGEVSRALGRGRHTTRHVEIYRMAGDGGTAEIIDTPGFSFLKSEDLNLELKEHLPETFTDFRPYLDRCRYQGCSHTKEAGCAVLSAVRRGDIPESRHRSYVRIYEQLKNLRAWEARRG